MKNRTIRFRGKAIDTGRWIFGHYFITPLTDENSGAPQNSGWFFLTGEKRHCISNENGAVFVVDEKTVGQSTCLRDKNGTEIFEGDIVKYTFRGTKPEHVSVVLSVFFHEGVFAIAKVNDEPLSLRDAIKLSLKADGLGIIGEIYSNPDLLNY